MSSDKTKKTSKRRDKKSAKKPSSSQKIDSILHAHGLTPAQIRAARTELKKLEQLGQDLKLSDKEIGELLKDIRLGDLDKDVEQGIAKDGLTVKLNAKEFEFVSNVGALSKVEMLNLDQLTGHIGLSIKEKAPELLPTKPPDEGQAVAKFPLSFELLDRLMTAAAHRLGQDGTMIWNDGINSIAVDLNEIKTRRENGVLVVRIQVLSKEFKNTTMTVPFSLGDEKTAVGLVMATSEKAYGEPTIARIWGANLVTLAYGALMLSLQEFAKNMGRDSNNLGFIPVAVALSDGGLLLTLGSRYKFRYRDGGKEK